MKVDRMVISQNMRVFLPLTLLSLGFFSCKKATTNEVRNAPLASLPKDACQQVGTKLALALVPLQSGADSSELIVKNIAFKNEASSSGEPRPVRIQFEASSKVNFVRWRACSDKGICLPSSNANDWYMSGLFDESSAILTDGNFTFSAQGCLEETSKEEPNCGKILTQVYKISHEGVPEGILSAQKQLAFADQGIWDEAFSLRSASLGALKALQALPMDIRKNPTYKNPLDMIEAVSTNYDRLKTGDLWRYMIALGQDFKAYYNKLATSASELNLTAGTEPSIDCPEEVKNQVLNKDSSSSDLLSALLGGSSGSSGSFGSGGVLGGDPASSSEPAPITSPANTNQSTADTPSPAKNSANPSDKNKNPETLTGYFLMGVGIAGVLGSFAHFYLRDDNKVLRQYVFKAWLYARRVTKEDDVRGALKNTWFFKDVKVEDFDFAGGKVALNSGFALEGKKALVGYTILSALVLGTANAINTNQEDKKKAINLTATGDAQRVIQNYLDKLAQIQSAFDDLLERRELAIKSLGI